MKRQTITTLYGILVFLMILIVFIVYAQVTTELKAEGAADGTEQQGVYITDVEYLTNNGADTENSKVNYFLGTMLDSKVVLGSSSSSTITYKVTIKNNTEREQVFIGIVKDDTNEIIYSNTNIEQSVETAGGITGIEKGVTTIAPGEKLTFPVTFKYVSGASTTNTELQSKINFRFRELPIVELSNEGETYTLEDVAPGYEKEIEFTVSNYNKDYTNGVPLTYSFETEFTEGSPLVAKIYDKDGIEVTKSIEIAGDKTTQEDHTYTLKLTWDSSLNGSEYRGQEYTCNVAVKATPDDAENLGYGDYVLEKSFDINITTRSVIADGSWDGEVNTPILTPDMIPVAWDEEGNEFTPTTNEEWYDYVDQPEGEDGTSNWANAKTSDGSYWVWIPRYEYKIDASNVTSTSDAGTIDVNFIPISTNATTSGYTTTTDINTTVSGVEVLSKGITVSSDGYIIHPSFTSDVNVGGWDSELAGIWVAKYEMSMETSGSATTTHSSSIGNVATSSTIKAVSKPGVTSWRYINISNAYENSLSYDTDKESHLMKNSEWGAVAYLTHSSYGRNGTAVTMNSNSSYYTAGGSGATATTNVAQSSTGNETGIYDLSGGGSEHVAAFNDGYSSTGTYYTGRNYLSASGSNMGTIGLANGGNTKYLTAYSNSTAHSYIGQSSGDAYTSHSAFAAGGYTVSITGDAISEVWTETSYAWFGDESWFVYSSYPFFLRGRDISYGSGVGVFDSWNSVGAGDSGYSFRVCLTQEQIQANCTHTYSDWVTVKEATCVDEGTQKRICSKCGATEIQTIAALGHNYVNGVCSRCGALEPLPTTTPYVGYYADLEGDGTVDGVIFVDQGYGQVGDGEWGTNGWGTYTIPQVTSGLKNYYVSQESYAGKFGTKPVISPVSGTTGTDRFYVMALSDFDSSTHYWYYNASGLDNYIGSTEQDFGEGKAKTADMISKWNSSYYGSQNSNDMWGLIQSKVAKGWFVPSKSEWSAFGGELCETIRITTSNYSAYGLKISYWSSTQSEPIIAYHTNFYYGYMHRYGVFNEYNVRLCATF